MFFVVNKQKIISYLIACSTVAILLFGANFFVPQIENTIQTSTSTKNALPIYSVDTQNKNIALTMNCAW